VIGRVRKTALKPLRLPCTAKSIQFSEAAKRRRMRLNRSKRVLGLKPWLEYEDVAMLFAGNRKNTSRSV
jgi:hypothetical protein